MTIIAKGHCTCGTIRYEVKRPPLFVHCCHCRRCQRESGSAFALNALIEADNVKLLSGAPEIIDTPSDSGKGQLISRCPDCKVAVWSIYHGAGPRFFFLRVGTLENPDAFAPDIHIYTESKQPWVRLPEGVSAVPGYYRRSEYWPQESLQRREKALSEPD